MLWQLAYTEIYFEKKLWPDFNEKDFVKLSTNLKNEKKFWKYLMKQELKNRILSSIVILPIAFVAKGSIFFMFLRCLIFIYLLRMVKNYKK